MKSSNLLLIVLLLTLVTGCGSGGPAGTAAPSPAASGSTTGNPADGSSNGSGGGATTLPAAGPSATDGSGGATTLPAAGSGTATVTPADGSSGSGGATTPPAAGSGDTPPSIKNVLPITVNGSLCSGNLYPNKPCVSVTVCTPGTSTCQTINDILLDTGSYGLRLFKQAINVSLPQVAGGSGSLAECVQYADGSSEWGPVKTASVILGNEPAVQLPIQVVDSAFATPPSACRESDESPAEAGFNGILGVGLFVQDCGAKCTYSASNGMYYACSGSSCSGTTVPLAGQVQNPVALLPQDNNGVIVRLPNVPPGGAPSVDGYLVLGIGTQSNNAAASVTTYAANQYGEFTTKLGGFSTSSFIDSGSNGLFFTPPSGSLLPNCPSPGSGWFCPSSATSLSATNTGASGSSSGVVSFQIGNYFNLASSSNNVFAEIGGRSVGGDFDWGLPFYFGRNVYLGFEGRGSSLGSGPYWAY